MTDTAAGEDQQHARLTLAIAALAALATYLDTTILFVAFPDPSPALAAALAPRLGSLAGRIGQRPLVIVGGLLFAAAGLYLGRALGPGQGELGDYLIRIAVPLLAVAISVPLVFPQVTSAAAQALPPNRVGVGGAVTQAVRQFGGSFGVAITITLIGSAAEMNELVTGFDRIWWFLVLGGLATTLSALPLRTSRAG